MVSCRRSYVNLRWDRPDASQFKADACRRTARMAWASSTRRKPPALSGLSRARSSPCFAFWGQAPRVVRRWPLLAEYPHPKRNVGVAGSVFGNATAGSRRTPSDANAHHVDFEGQNPKWTSRASSKSSGPTTRTGSAARANNSLHGIRNRPPANVASSSAESA